MLPHTRAVTLICLLLVTALATACGGSSESGAPDNPTSVAPTVVPTPTPSPAATATATVPATPTDAVPSPSATPGAPSGIRLDDLTTLRWRLIELDGAALLGDAFVVLDLGQRESYVLAGVIGCWGYGARLEQDERGIWFVPSSTGEGVTLDPRDCPDPHQRPALVDDYVAALSAADDRRVTDERLEILDSGGTSRLVYEPLHLASLPAALTDRTWMLRSLRGEEPLPGVGVTLQFDAYGVSGRDGCNWYNSGAIVDGDGMFRFAWPGVMQTMMACITPAGVMEQAHAYIQALTEADSYRLDEDRLEVIDRNGETLLVFAESGIADLGGVTWSLSMIHHPIEFADLVLEGTEVTLVFDGDAVRLFGSAGCNGYGAPIELDGATMTVGEVTRELKLCVDPPGIMEQEQQFLDVLDHVTTWDLDGTSLRLTADDGRVLELWPKQR